MYLGQVNIFRKFLSKFKEKVSQKYRREVLVNTISNEISNIIKSKNKKIIKILDYGSGYNPILIKKINEKLSIKHKKIQFRACCYDYYSKKQIKLLNNSKKIVYKNINKLNSDKIIKYDFCLIIDVLHHIGIDDSKKIYKIVNKLKKKSNFLIIKDHFQYGFFSNFTLILMDFFSNYGDGTKIPKIYFNIQSFNNLISKVKLEEIKRITNKKFYRWYWLYLNSEKFQFISVLK